MTIPRINRILVLLTYVLVCTSLVRAETIPGLGTATFPTSTHSAAASREFMRGLLLLHLFEYEDARRSFVAAEMADPGFAMAYWGDAMTFNHPVWNELNAKAGQAALAKFEPTPEARAQRIADPRERAWFSAVEILYSGAGSKPERDARTRRPCSSWPERIRKTTKRSSSTHWRCWAKAKACATFPPTCRPRRSRRQSSRGTPTIRVRPTTGFMRWTTRSMLRGRWCRRMRCRRSRPVRRTRNICARTFSWHWECGMEWWRPTLQQPQWLINMPPLEEGRPDIAATARTGWSTATSNRVASAQQRSVVAGCREEAMQPGMAAEARGTVDPDDAVVSSFVEMRARYLVDTGRWQDEVAGWKVDMGDALMPEINDAFATGFAAAERGDLPTARNALAALPDLLPQTPAAFDQPARRQPIPCAGFRRFRSCSCRRSSSRRKVTQTRR